MVKYVDCLVGGVGKLAHYMEKQIKWSLYITVFIMDPKWIKDQNNVAKTIKLIKHDTSLWLNFRKVFIKTSKAWN